MASVREFWEAEACGERYGDEQDRIRYELEPEIEPFAKFAEARGRKVLEIGVGMGADFLRWARNGADATGVDLTERAIGITKERLAAEGLEAHLQTANAQELPFEDASFDIVYSWGVLSLLSRHRQGPRRSAPRAAARRPGPRDAVPLAVVGVAGRLDPVGMVAGAVAQGRGHPYGEPRHPGVLGAGNRGAVRIVLPGVGEAGAHQLGSQVVRAHRPASAATASAGSFSAKPQK